MGMFDKDKEMGLVLTTWIAPNVEFVIWGASVVRDDFPTDLGPATQVKLQVSRLENLSVKYDVTTLASAIAAKVKEADDSDFPAVVWWMKVPSRYNQDATVLQFVRPLNPAPADTREQADA